MPTWPNGDMATQTLKIFDVINNFYLGLILAFLLNILLMPF